MAATGWGDWRIPGCNRSSGQGTLVRIEIGTAARSTESTGDSRGCLA
jgi:hypothetical protein